MSSTTTSIAFADLLKRAITEPGIISPAYQQFHNYSFGNVLLAFVQCHSRGIPLGPIATYPRWQELGRHVRRGEKAITLCQPVTINRKTQDNPETADEPECFVRFVYRPRWFVLAQTEGEPVPVAELPSWDKTQALSVLDVAETPFDHPNGNVMGYARQRALAISPLNPHPTQTLFHELAHILLGHTTIEEQTETETLPRRLQEVEAEAVALLCSEALGLGGVAESRGYIQSWWRSGEAIPEASARRILRATDEILRAGREAVQS